jgi:hypothetical protein
MKSPKGLSRRKELGAKVIYAAFQFLKERGGEVPSKDVINELEKRLTLDNWAKETLGSGVVRWKAILNIFSIDCKKAGFLNKNRGMWSLTQEGQKALQLGEIGLLKSAFAEGVSLEIEQKLIDLTNQIADLDTQIRDEMIDKGENYFILRKKFHEIFQEIKHIIFDICIKDTIKNHQTKDILAKIRDGNYFVIDKEMARLDRLYEENPDLFKNNL